jgi:hypothetical protein
MRDVAPAGGGLVLDDGVGMSSAVALLRDDHSIW